MPDAPQSPYQFPEQLDAQVTITVAGDSTILRALTASGTPPTGGGDGAPAHETAPTGLPDFVLHRRIGIGGFGEVWEAEQESLGRAVALKRLRPAEELPAGARGDASRLFELEAKLTAQLDHPNIVPVHGLVRDEHGVPHLCMKLVRGRAWDELLREEHGKTTAEEYLTRHLGILISVAQAVAFAHSRGVVHRDLKPSQVMVGEFGEVQLLDWGLAIRFGEDDSKPSTPLVLPTPSNASSPSGTPAFMAPEQTGSNAREVGPWTDVYLLGASLFFLLTGRPPHGGSTAREAFGRAAMGEVLPFVVAAPDRAVPEDLGGIALRAMALLPQDRHRDVPEFIGALQDWMSGASKRRESEAITDAVARDLSGSGMTHGQFAHWTGQLGNARGLWPENPALPSLKDRLHEQWATFALRGGDFALARAEAEQIRDSVMRERSLDQVQDAEEARAAKLRQRRLAFGAAAVALAAALVLGALFAMEKENARREMAAANIQLQQERDVARRERDRSVAVRVDSERLVGLILEDMSEQMERIGRLDMMENAARETARYYEQLAPDERTHVRVRQGASAWFTLASAKFNQGHYAESLEALAKSEEIASGLHEAIPGDLDLRDGLASIQMLRASALDLLGNHAEASAQRELAAATFVQLIESGDAPATIFGDLLILRHDELTLQVKLANRDAARDVILRTLPIIESGKAKFPRSMYLGECIESFLLKAAEAAQLHGEHDLALQYVREAKDAVPAPEDPREGDLVARQKRTAIIGSTTAQILAARGDRIEALELLEESIVSFRRLRAEAPADRSIAHNLHTFLNLKGAWQFSNGDLGGSQETFEELIGRTREYLAQFPDDAENLISCIFALEAQITIMLQLADVQRALLLTEERGELVRRMESRFPGDIRTLDAHAKSAEHRAMLAELEADPDGAERWWIECIAVHQQLLEREPTKVVRRENLVLSQVRLGTVYYNLGEVESAEPVFQEAANLARELHRDHPGHGDYLQALLTAENVLAVLAQQRGALDESLTRLRALEELATTFQHGDDSAAPVAQYWLPILWYNLACNHAKAGELEHAFDAMEKAAASGQFGRSDFSEDEDLRPLREADPARFERMLPAE